MIKIRHRMRVYNSERFEPKVSCHYQVEALVGAVPSMLSHDFKFRITQTSAPYADDRSEQKLCIIIFKILRWPFS